MCETENWTYPSEWLTSRFPAGQPEESKWRANELYQPTPESS